jgi:hypothetical protein
VKAPNNTKSNVKNKVTNVKTWSLLATEACRLRNHTQAKGRAATATPNNINRAKGSRSYKGVSMC